MDAIEQTQKAATRIAALLRAGDVVGLYGPMGSGKTTLVKYIARALKTTDAVSSPTFSLAQRYDGTLPLWHLDLYRIEEADLYDIGYEDYFYPEEAATLIEWPEKAGSLLPETAFTLCLTKNENRTIQIDPRLLEREQK